MIKKIAGLASIPSRIESLRYVVDSIIGQIDEFHIYLNNYSTIPDFLSRDKVTIYRSQDFKDLTDIGKFYPLFNQNVDCYFFSIDDDIIYPANYAERMIGKIKSYDEKALICVHGNVLPRRKLESYFAEKKCLQYHYFFAEDQKVDVPGTGTLAFRSNLLKLSLDDFPLDKMSDIWIFKKAFEKKIDVISIEREKNWLRAYMDILEREDAISYDVSLIDKQVTETINHFRFQ
jgi:hypothetical protein